MNVTDTDKKAGFTELEDKYFRALLLIQKHINEPDVVKSIVDKAIGRPEEVVPIEEAEAEAEAEAEQQTINDIVNNNDQTGMQQAVNDVLVKEPKEDDHFGEEQADGLAEIFKGLKEGPNDNRW